MIKVWMLCEYVNGEIRRTAEAKKEGILDAGWYTREQLTGEVLFPSLLMERDWGQIRSGTDEVDCLPTSKARF
jgi:hypothetical protein